MVKKLQELTLKDNFMFTAVMIRPENCKGMLERVLGIQIERVEVSLEKCLIYHPEYKGVRLDIYAKDERHTHYNVEMQAVRKEALGKRSRYYTSQMDMELLSSGKEYSELPNTCVIFICDFDPFGQGKYRYTFKQTCQETEEADLEDGCSVIFLSTKGKNDDEVPGELIRFLKLVGADQKESEQDSEDAFVKQLQKTMREVKVSREMGARYVIFQEMLRDERKAGLAEGEAIGLAKGKTIGLAEGKTIGLAEGKTIGRSKGLSEGRSTAILELLEEFGKIPNDLRERIQSEENLEVLKKWNKLAAKVSSIEEFQKNM